MDIVETSRNFWIEAGREFNFEIITPVDLATLGHSSSRMAFAYLPQYGSVNGMMLHYMDPSTLRPDLELWDIANKLGLWVSFFNMDIYNQYDSERAREALEDWYRYKP